MIFSSLFLKKNKKVIAFSFDDGPSRQYTKKILNILKRNNAKASFFVLGSKIEEYSDVLKEMIDWGNEIGNHSYNHEDVEELTYDELYKSIKITQDLIHKSIDYNPKLVRFPGGNTNNDCNKIANKLNLSIVKWSIDSCDWFIKDGSVICDNVLNELYEGSIILFHDIYPQTVDVVKKLLKVLNKKGYQVTTISEMFEYYGVELKTGKQYSEVIDNEKN